MKKKKKGMSLIEVVIAMTLAILVLGFIGTFFRINSEINANTYIKSDLQSESQIIQDEIMSFGMQAKQIDKVILSGGESSEPYDDKKNVEYYKLSTSGELPQIKEIEILSLEEDSSGNIVDVNYTLRYDKINKILSLQKNDGSIKKLSSNVEEFEIKPTNENKTFAESTSININVVLSHRKAQIKPEDAKVSSNMVIVLRNKK